MPFSQETSEEDAEAGCAPKKKMTLGSYFKIAEQALPPNNQESSVACELESYLQLSYLDSEADPLKWWKEHEKIYPRLSEVAKKNTCAYQPQALLQKGLLVLVEM